MINERCQRRPGFAPGIPVLLADGQEWWLPAPADVIHAEGPIDAEYAALIEGVAWAEDAAELGRAALALGIYLLDRNYLLGPGDFQELLEAHPGSLQSARVCSVLQAVAEAHVPSHSVEDRPPSWGIGWRGMVARFAHRALGRRIDSTI